MGKTLIPDDFQITDSMRQWARMKVPGLDIDSQHEMFVDYWRAHGKKMLDWQATWRNWMRRAPEFARPSVNRYSQVERRTPKPPECRHGLPPYSCAHCKEERERADAGPQLVGRLVEKMRLA